MPIWQDALNLEFPFFIVVSAMECNLAKSSAPSSVRKPPLIFCFIFIFLTPRLLALSNWLDNASERSVRPVKTKIKVSGQFRSDDGAKNYATLMSIALTARKNGKNPFFAFQKLAEYYEE